MSQSNYNSSGSQIGANGFVLCRTCGKETRDISRETGPEYAFCRKHWEQPSSQKGTDTMGHAVPKPSQKKAHAKTAKKEKKAKAAKAPRAKKEQGEKRDSLMGEIRDAGGMTREEILAAAERRGLSRKSGTNTAWNAEQKGLLKKSDKPAKAEKADAAA